ncbi:hypothetical protein O988_02003, partial [Pseudogymnoascus sp. VKM F-3808]
MGFGPPLYFSGACLSALGEFSNSHNQLKDKNEPLVESSSRSVQDSICATSSTAARTTPALATHRIVITAFISLFDEHFTITASDHSKYDRVSRISATSQDSQTTFTLDINTELFPCVVGEPLHMVLASTLSLDGSKDDNKGWRDVGRSGQGGEATLADLFDYVCHGKIYKFEDGDDGNI